LVLAVGALLLRLTTDGIASAAPAEALEAVRAEVMRPVEPRATAAESSPESPREQPAAEGLAGRVLCGYQGWFNTPADGAGLGWKHWSRTPSRPPAIDTLHVDLLPDVSELAADERFTSGLLGADGRPVEVFSSRHPATVDRHFRWMREYGIDGGFVQRFAEQLSSPDHLRNCTVVLGHCRTAALRHGRVYAVMYDLTGLERGRSATVIDDWRALRSRMRIGDDPASLRLGGRPLVAVWGIGFADRDYRLEDCRRIVEAFRDDGCAVLAGVPTGWRTLDRDAAADPELHAILARCQVVSPWTVGRYRNAAEVRTHADRDWSADLRWCRERGIDYLPVVFPGFSWHNLHGGPLGEIPRDRGRFLWSQFGAAARIGAPAAYVAMFDEVDEATAIFKCAEPPAGDPARRLLGLEGLPSDHYLQLSGAARRLLHERLPFPEEPPIAIPAPPEPGGAPPSR
jgi:hypothetical protein